MPTLQKHGRTDAKKAYVSALIFAVLGKPYQNVEEQEIGPKRKLSETSVRSPRYGNKTSIVARTSLAIVHERTSVLKTSG